MIHSFHPWALIRESLPIPLSRSMQQWEVSHNGAKWCYLYPPKEFLDLLEATIIKILLCVDRTGSVALVCDNRSHQITQALQMQMEVQKRLHEQLEVTLSLDLSQPQCPSSCWLLFHPSPLVFYLFLYCYSLLSRKENSAVTEDLLVAGICSYKNG